MRAVLALLLALACGAVRAQDGAVLPAAPALQISLLTFAPGEVYWQRYGHNALRVRSGTYDAVYNYGMFDFAQEDFFLNFARGRMQYQLAVHGLPETLSAYAQEGRWIYEQVLDLDAEQAGSLASYLVWNAQPENAGYGYDYFLSNCSTRVRDALDRTLAGALKQRTAALPTTVSFRTEGTRMIAPLTAAMMGMDLGMGPRTDRPLSVWEHAFLPGVLMEAVAAQRIATADGPARPLVREAHWLLPPPRPELPAERPRLWPGCLLAGLALAGLLTGLHRGRAAPWARRSAAALAGLLSLLAGLAGLVLLAGWTLTEHWAMWQNHNLLLLGPWNLLLLPAWWRRARGAPAGRLAQALAALNLIGVAVAVVLLALPAAQDHLHWILLLAPLHAALFRALRD